MEYYIVLLATIVKCIFEDDTLILKIGRKNIYFLNKIIYVYEYKAYWSKLKYSKSNA